MADFLPQSTDRSRENPNPLTSHVVLEGSTPLTVALATGFYSGSATVSLPLDTQYANLVVEAWIRTQASGGGNPVAYSPLCQTRASSAGVLSSAGSITILNPAKAGTYDIRFTYISSEVPLSLTHTVYYRIKTDRISEDGLSFV